MNGVITVYTPLKDFKLAIAETSQRNLIEQVNLILQTMQMERDNANTHSQRNAYQAVIRNELEVLRSALIAAHTNVLSVPNPSDDVPF